MDSKKSLSNDKEALNIISSYGKGQIDLDRCYELLKQRKEEKNLTGANAEKLTKILDEKLEREYTKFCNSLKAKSPEEIIEKSYELIVKRELKDEIKNLSWHDKEMAIMIDQVDLLDEFYHDWLDTDIALGDVLIDSLEESVSTLTRYYGKQNLFRVIPNPKDIDR